MAMNKVLGTFEPDNLFAAMCLKSQQVKTSSVVRLSM